MKRRHRRRSGFAVVDFDQTAARFVILSFYLANTLVFSKISATRATATCCDLFGVVEPPDRDRLNMSR